jgi:hypothetical protein
MVMSSVGAARSSKCNLYEYRIWICVRVLERAVKFPKVLTWWTSEISEWRQLHLKNTAFGKWLYCKSQSGTTLTGFILIGLMNHCDRSVQNHSISRSCSMCWDLIRKLHGFESKVLVLHNTIIDIRLSISSPLTSSICHRIRTICKPIPASVVFSSMVRLVCILS